MTRKRADEGYHHGNLRAALISAGLRLIEKKGVRALTLREIGARVGVSRTAAYRHFADKEDLLGAICEAGFVRFGDVLEIARRGASGGFAARLGALALAYVRFAVEHPAHYEVMFGWRGNPADAGSSQKSEAAGRAFGILEDTIRDGQRTGEVREGESVMLARMVWAQVHGICTLGLAGDLSAEGEGARFVVLCADVMSAGLAGEGE